MGRHLKAGSFEDQVSMMKALGKIGCGDTYWVGNGSDLTSRVGSKGSNRNSGESQLSPLSTVAAGMAKCVDGANDNVILLPGHAESIAAADGWNVQKAGITFFGLGRGQDRPTFTFTATTSDVEIDAAQTTIENCRFLCAVDELAAAIDVNAADFHFIGNEFRLTDATNGATYHTIDVLQSIATSSDGLWIKRNLIWGLGAATATGGTHVLYDIGADFVEIEDNYFQGAFTSGEGAIFQDTAAGVGWKVLRNIVNNTTTGCTVGMSLNAGTTGFKDENSWGILSAATPVIAAGMQWGIDMEQGSVGAIATEV